MSRATLPPRLQGRTCSSSPGSWWPRVPWPVASSIQPSRAASSNLSALSVHQGLLCAPSLLLRRAYAVAHPRCPRQPREMGLLCCSFLPPGNGWSAPRAPVHLVSPPPGAWLSTSVRLLPLQGRVPEPWPSVPQCPSHRVFRFSTEVPPEGEEQVGVGALEASLGTQGVPQGEPSLSHGQQGLGTWRESLCQVRHSLRLLPAGQGTRNVLEHRYRLQCAR